MLFRTFLRDAQALILVALTQTIIQQATTLLLTAPPPVRLRTLAAVHVASARVAFARARRRAWPRETSSRPSRRCWTRHAGQARHPSSRGVTGRRGALACGRLNGLLPAPAPRQPPPICWWHAYSRAWRYRSSARRLAWQPALRSPNRGGWRDTGALAIAASAERARPGRVASTASGSQRSGRRDGPTGEGGADGLSGAPSSCILRGGTRHAVPLPTCSQPAGEASRSAGVARLLVHNWRMGRTHDAVHTTRFAVVTRKGQLTIPAPIRPGRGSRAGIAWPWALRTARSAWRG